MGAAHKGSILLAMIWMFLISLVLFWIPIAGSLIAGLVGGKTAGSVGRGLLAAALPVLLLGGLLFFVATALTGVPVIGVLASFSLVFLLLIYELPLLVGAFVGGLLD